MVLLAFALQLMAISNRSYCIPRFHIMPRRSPPTSLRLVQGSLPTRGQPKHTLPSMPRPTLLASNISRAQVFPSIERERTYGHGRNMRSNVESVMVLSSSNRGCGVGIYGQADVDANISGSSFESLPLPSSSSPVYAVNSRRGSFESLSSVSSRASSPTPQSRDKKVIRGPWDHSPAPSLEVDVDFLLAIPQRVAVSP